MFNMNGAPKGYNSTSDQASYDLVYKDIIVKSENRDPVKYPNPNNYVVSLGDEITKIYKAEIITANIPAATDIAVNIPSTANRLYFNYNDGSSDNYGFIRLQTGTYLSPATVGVELQRQFDNVVGSSLIVCIYNTNYNRYVFSVPAGKTLTLYPINGTTAGAYTVQESVNESLNLYVDPLLNVTNAINIITDNNGLLQVVDAGVSNGWYGSYNGVSVTTDSQFSNSIVSDLVLTGCNLYLSLGILNSNTIKFVSNDNPAIKSNLSNIFCEIPNNTSVSSASVKTLLNEPCVWSGMNFYNPPLASLIKLDVKWVNEYGELMTNISDQCFTIRVYYFQKRNSGTSFSIPVVNYTSTNGTIDSIFSTKN